MRVKSKWNRKDKTHTVEEIGEALAYIAFRIAQNGVLTLENNDYQTDTQEQRLRIIAEFLYFTIHLIDRMTIDRFEHDDRMRFMTALATKSAKHMEDNMRDILGKGDYQAGFIDALNQRMSDYAEFQFDKEEGGPSFPMRRFFGDLVTQQMGEKNKRWVTDQIIDIEVPEILTTLNRSIPNLFM